ncbi:MAG: DNA polymerase IV [Labilithrix sp.]
MTTRQILHIDMDAFFASVEQRDDPSLRGKAIVVGGQARRGVVAAASYEARKYGIRSAMPMAEALRRYPQLIVVPPHGDRYAEASDRVFEVFHRYTPLVEGLSIDEAFLDVTASQSLFGDGSAIAKRIRAEVFEETQLTCSAGVAASKFVAKIASDMQKPDGLTVAPEPIEELRAFLAPLPIERMWGVGPKTAPTMRAMGLRTFADLAKADPKVVGDLRDLALGIDPREVVPDREAKSIGAECTYEHDLTTREEIARTLLAHSSRCAERLTESGLHARAVVVKLKLHDFTLLTRRKTLDAPASDTRTIHEACLELLDRFPLRGARVRLTGVQAQELGTGEPAQASLFRDVKQDRRRAVESVVLKANLTFATLLEDNTPRTAPEGDLEKKGSWASKRRPV